MKEKLEKPKPSSSLKLIILIHVYMSIHIQTQTYIFSLKNIFMFHFKDSLNKVKYGKQTMFFVNNIEKLINLLKYTQCLLDILKTKGLVKAQLYHDYVTLLSTFNLSRVIYLPLCLSCSQISSLDKCKNNVKMYSPSKKIMRVMPSFYHIKY